MILFLIFCALAAYSSYTDLRYRKINNRLILSGLLIEAAVFLLRGNTFGAGHLLNAVLSIALALVVWKCSVWAAGDAKFFIFSGISCSLFVPSALEASARAHVPLALILLCNALILAFCFIFLEGLVGIVTRFVSSIRAGELGSTLTHWSAWRPLRAYGKVYLSYLFAFLFFSLVSPVLSVPMGYLHAPRLVFFVVMYALYYPISKYSVKIPLAVFLVLVATGLWLVPGGIFATLKQSFLFFIFVTVATSVVNRRIGRNERVAVPRDLIAPGLMVAREEVEKIDSGTQRAHGLRCSPDGLTPQQAGWWREYCVSCGKQTLEAYTTFPFVPFIALAAALTFIAGARPLTLFPFLR